MQTRILCFQFGDPRLQRRHCRLDQCLDSAFRVRPCHSSLITDLPRLTNINLSGAMNGYAQTAMALKSEMAFWAADHLPSLGDLITS